MLLLPEAGRAGVVSVVAVLLSMTGADGQPLRSGKVSFAEEVLPLLEQKCHHCHGLSQQNSGLDVRTREDVLIWICLACFRLQTI